MFRCIFLSIIVVIGISNQSKGCEIKVGWEDWPPYQFKNQGKVSGLDIEIVGEVAKAAGCKLILKEVPWKRQLVDIKKGRADLALGASKNKEREKFSVFTSSYRNETMSLFVGGKSKKIENLDELIKLISSGKFKLGITRGYFYGDKFKTAMSDPNFSKKIEEVKSTSQNLEKCKNGRIDGFFGDKFVVSHSIKQKNYSDKVFPTTLDLNSDSIFFMLSKNSVSPDSLNKIQRGLDKISKDGTLQNIKNRYLNTN